MNSEHIYFMFSRSRSGTGALNTILQQHEDIVCLWEVFNIEEYPAKKYHIPEEINYFNWLYNHKITISGFIRNNYKNFCDYLEMIDETFPNKKIIIDVKYNTFHYFNGIHFSSRQVPEILRFIKQHNFPCINLIRRNKLDVYTSLQLAHHTRTYHTEDDSKLKNKTVNLDINGLKDFLCETARDDEFLENYFNSMNLVAKFEYEDLFVNGKLTEPVAKKLEQVLDVSGLSKFSTPLKKQVKSLEDIIENFDEVSLFLKKTYYSNGLNIKDDMYNSLTYNNSLSLRESQLVNMISNLEKQIDRYLSRYPKWIIHFIALFIPKKKNRHHFREKYSR